MNDFDKILNRCIESIKHSDDMQDDETFSSFILLLNTITTNPSIIVGYGKEMQLSVVLSCILTSGFTNRIRYINNIKTSYLVFAAGYYLFMHQLENGTFYDKNWPSFLVLLQEGKDLHANLIVANDPSSQGSPYNVMDMCRFQTLDLNKYRIVRGIEFNMMIVAHKTGFLPLEFMNYLNNLETEAQEILADNPFQKYAIPLYKTFAKCFKSGDLDFLDIE